MTLKIFGDVVSPFVRMALVTAHEAGLNDRVERLQAGVKPTEVNSDLQKLSPIAKVPVLVTEHAHAIHDSRVIMEYLAHVSGQSQFIPHDGVKRFHVLTLQATAQGMADASVLLRYEQTQRPEEKRWPEYKTRLIQRIDAALDDLEKNGGDVLADVNVGSISAACAIGYIDFRHAALDWRKGRSKLTQFFDGFSARASMQAYPLA
ncbi:MAG: glutathione S-transferase family protein [Proteobacteria bacterium]|nr:glutathione S-transferase family protein [Pseudomonadota bacterium]